MCIRDSYTGTLICDTDEGIITEHQNCFRGGKKQPLTKEDIDKKYKANLKFSKLQDKDYRNLLSNNAKANIENNFSLKRLSADLKQLIEDEN